MHAYTSTIRWQRAGAKFTDNRYRRAHYWDFDGGVRVPASSSPLVVPVPLSDPACVDPEEAFVAALSSCHMLWFLSLAARDGFTVDEYRDQATGRMSRNAEGLDVMSHVLLSPLITFSGEKLPEHADVVRLHHRAHASCYLANSVKTTIETEGAWNVASVPTVHHWIAPAVRIIRLAQVDEDAVRLLEEYYDAVNVVQRDNAEAIGKLVSEPASGLWLAYLDGKAVGCVVLRRLPSIQSAGECKRLYVQPEARGNGIAQKLLDVQEDFARREGLEWIYLDSYDDLTAALALYRKRGYVPCERYNDNPQATVFMRKRLRSEPR